MSTFEMVLGTASSGWSRWGGPGSGLTGRSDMVTAGAMASLRVDLADLASKEDADEDNGTDDDCKNETLARLDAWAEIKKQKLLLHADRNTKVQFDPNLLRHDRDVREAMAADEISGALTLDLSSEIRAMVVGTAPLVRLSRPDMKTTVQKQAEIVHKRAKKRDESLKDGGRSVLHLHQLVAQHLDPLQPYAGVLGISYETHPRTIELISSACTALGPKLFRLKTSLAIERPHKKNPNLVPMLDVPGHLSYPGGHSAKTFLASTLLSSLAHNEDLKGLLWKLAAIVSNNRVKAALHYPMDTVAGAVLGFQVGRWLISVALSSNGVNGLALESKLDGDKSKYQIDAIDPVGHAELPVWRQMFLAASNEW